MYVIIYKATAKAKWVALPTLYKNRDEAIKSAEVLVRDVQNAQAKVRWIEVED